MPISHTNRKGQTFFLRQGITSTGKPRYFFSKTSGPGILEQIPAGYHIEESVNGIVSLVKDREQLIRPEEIQVIQKALNRHPKGKNYRVSAKGKQITISERIGPDPETIADIFGGKLTMYSRHELLDSIQRSLDKNDRFSPMLHFILMDTAARLFSAERVTHVSSLPGWISISGSKPLQSLVDQIIPLLDTDDYFELIL